MRRPRTKLQVSTFPFLAVLLCAMGSLLLFLFIMDRRAKIASRHRAQETMEAMAAKKKETQAEYDARQAEWEQAKEKLRRMLLDQQGQLATESRGIEQHRIDADQLLAAAQARLLALEPKLGSEAEKIAAMQNQLQRQRDNIQLADQKQSASKTELAEATIELAELQIAFQQLKERRSREKEVYSLVPYRGKRGDQRTPIYVECVREGVLFHPDKKLLQGEAFTVLSLRGEVESRTGPLQREASEKEKSRVVPQEKKGPYVLFLVRPDGINQYYKAQAALRGFQLDFGYELVDEHWVLDFAGEAVANQKPAPSSLLAQTPPTPVHSGTALAPLPFPTGSAGNRLGGSNGNTGPLAPPIPDGIPGSGSVPGNLVTGIKSPPNFGGIPGPTSPGAGNPRPGLPGSGIPGSGIPGADDPRPGNPGPNNLGGGSPGLGRPTPTTPDRPTMGLTNALAPVREPSFVPLSRIAPMVPIASSGPVPIPIASSVGSIPGTGGNPSSPAPPGNGIPPGLTGVPMPEGNRPVERANAEGRPGNTGSGGSGNANDSFSGQKPTGVPEGVPDAPASKALAGPMLVGSGAVPRKAAASPLSNILGNKDFVITIDCFTDHVTIFPGGVQYRWTAADTREVDRAVVQTVTKLIERRQASVRPGDPPYRPLIRFQVSPEGLRSYYQVYPLLEHLRIPMTRENVED